MDDFVPLKEKYKEKLQENIYYSDGFKPRYYFNNIVKDMIIEKDKVIISKRHL